jgi:hypothetical protein
MKKFICEVVRTDKYIIEIDETKVDEKWLANYREYFYDYHTLEQHAEHLAQHRARFAESFIEGYGIPLVDGKKPWNAEDNQVESGINIKIVSEDDDCDLWVSEIE